MGGNEETDFLEQVNFKGGALGTFNIDGRQQQINKQNKLRKEGKKVLKENTYFIPLSCAYAMTL